MTEKPKNKGGRPTLESLKDKGGRPTVFTKEVLSKLEEAFKIGCTDAEACLNADIGVSTLYKYQKENPKFVERKEILKKTPTYRARKCLTMAVEKKPGLALKYLERKEKDEFSKKTEHEVSGVGLNDLLMGISPELAEAVKASLKDLVDKDKKK